MLINVHPFIPKSYIHPFEMYIILGLVENVFVDGRLCAGLLCGHDNASRQAQHLNNIDLSVAVTFASVLYILTLFSWLLQVISVCDYFRSGSVNIGDWMSRNRL